MLSRIGITFESTTPQGIELIAGIRSYADKHELEWEIIPLKNGPRTGSRLQFGTMDLHISALIGYRWEPWTSLATDTKAPQVFLHTGDQPDSNNVITFIPDDEAIGKMAARFAHERGFSTVAVVDGLLSPDIRLHRARAFLNHARFLGLQAFSFDHNMLSSNKINDMERQRIEWLRCLPDRPLLFFFHDHAAAWFCEHSGILGYHLPDEAAILSVSNLVGDCENCRPRLSSIAFAYRHIGFEAARFTHKLLSGTQSDGQIHHYEPLRVVDRESTSPEVVKDPLVRQALTHLAGHPTCSISALARQLGVSRTTLCQHFADAKQPTPKRIQLQHRLEAARKDVEANTMSLASIATRHGFSSVSSFSTAFRKYWGHSPKNWQKFVLGSHRSF